MLSETAENKRRELLRREIKELSNYALSGEVVERRFYFQLFSKKGEAGRRYLESQISHIKNAFENNQIRCDKVDEKEIIQICNLINNPRYVHLED